MKDAFATAKQVLKNIRREDYENGNAAEAAYVVSGLLENEKRNFTPQEAAGARDVQDILRPVMVRDENKDQAAAQLAVANAVLKLNVMIGARQKTV